jgi:hypothetical protein
VSISLEEKLNIVSEMENEGCDSTIIEALMECYDGKSTSYDRLTPEIIKEIINEED